MSRRPAGAETASAAGDGEAEAAGSWQLGEGNGGDCSADCYGSGGWEAGAAAPKFAGGWGPGCGSEFDSSSRDGQLASLLDAATAAADAATAWAGGYGCGSVEAAAGDEAWLQDHGLLSSGAAGPAASSASWHIPAVGADYSSGGGFASPQRAGRTSAPTSPAKQAAAAAGMAASPCCQRLIKGPALAATQSLQGSPSAPPLASVEADIAGLEDALRCALFDFQV